MSKENEKSAMIKQKIGSNIKQIRLTKNIPVKQVCSDLDLSQPAYSNIEKGLTDISITRILQIAEYFRVDYTEILALEKVTNYYINPKDSSTGIQNNNCQITNKDVDSLMIAIESLKEEVTYLREQNMMFLKTK
jgi:transcriptional regulator with XRE-family HTH domain